MPTFQCGACWWSISSPESKTVTTMTKPGGGGITVLTVMEQIGCTDNEMVNAFGTKWVSQLVKFIPFARQRKFNISKLVSISSSNFDNSIER